MNVNSTILGQRLRDARERVGMSQADFARAVSKDQGAISEYETGRRKVAAVDLVTFSQVLNIPITYFFEGQFDIDALDQTLLREFHTLPTAEAKLSVIKIIKTISELLK